MKLKSTTDLTGRRKKTNREVTQDLLQKIKPSHLAKSLGIKPRTLRSYYSVLATGKKESKHDRTPPEKIFKKLRKLASSKKIRLTVGSEKSEYRIKKLSKLKIKGRYFFMVKGKFEYYIKNVGLRFSWQTGVGKDLKTALEALEELRESMLDNESLSYIEITQISAELYTD